jgi:hypothetical protein
LLRLSGEAIFFDDVMMKVVSKKLSACTSTVAIINSEKRAFRPGFMLPLFWLNNVKDNRNPIFIVIPDEALVCICCISSDYAVALKAALGRFVIWNHNTGSRL